MSVQTPPAPKPRPLSPHLHIYKKQLTSATSIFHRLTGVGLTLGLPVLSLWLMAVAAGGETYTCVMSALKSPLGQLFLLGWTWALFYHLCNGIRHLMWDAGRLLSIQAAYRAGYIVIAASFLLTAAIWLCAYGMIP